MRCRRARHSAKHGGQERRITSEIKSGFEALPRQLAAQVAPQMNALLDEDNAFE